MDLPKLSIKKRDREFKSHSEEQREEMVIKYLFEGLSFREIDVQVLGSKDPGFDSMNTLKHYGLTKECKGLFAGKSKEYALEIMSHDPQYETICKVVAGTCQKDENIPVDLKKGITAERLIEIRVNQGTFRREILDAYNHSCCITGIREEHLLRASHIKPWCKSDEYEKLDVHNGLCLNSMHDAAFDTGLITIDSISYEVKLSPKIEEFMDEKIYDDFFRNYDGKEITINNPELAPRKHYLEYHKKMIFNKPYNYTTIEIEIDDHN